MAASTQDTLRTAKFRLCRLKKWPNYKGLGFALEKGTEPPHLIQLVESNSPAAAAGLRILDVILAVNKEDTTKVTFDKLKTTIKSVVDKQDTIEFLVIEKRQYETLKKNKVPFDRKYAQLLETPSTMPREYADFPPNTPRTCQIRLGPQDPSLGLELVTAERDTGAYVQDVAPGFPASKANLRKSDRIIEMDGDFVNDQPYSQITARLKGAKANGGVKLYVMDTATYKYYIANNMPLASGGDGDDDDGQPVDRDGSEPDTDVDEPDDGAPVLRRGQPATAPNDIRLCTLTKTAPNNSYGMALTYETALRQHSLKIIPGTNNEPSRAYAAGVREGDRLIEIDGENVQNMEDADVKNRIRTVQYPDPLELLVASPETADYYKKNGKKITSDLANPRRSADPARGSGIAPPSSSRTGSTTRPGLGGLVTGNPVDPYARPTSQSTTSSTRQNPPPPRAGALPPNARRVELRSRPNYTGLGFGLNTTEPLGTPNKFINIKPDSPAERGGLRDGDCIISINGQNVQDSSRQEVLKIMKDASTAEKNNGTPIAVVVTEERYLRQPSIRDTPEPPKPIYKGSDRDGRSSDRTPTPESTRQPTPVNRNPAQSSSLFNRRPSETDSPDTTYAPSRPKQPAVPRPDSSNYRKPVRTGSYRADEDYSSPFDSTRSDRAPSSRTGVDVISGKFMLRYYNLPTQPGQPVDFKIASKDQKHFIGEINPKSPAGKAGLAKDDEIIEVNEKFVAGRSHSDVTQLIKAANDSDELRLVVRPANVRLLTGVAKRSYPYLDYNNMQENSSISSSLDDISQRTLRPNQGKNLPQPFSSVTDLPNAAASPTQPLPRRCVIRSDSSFRGCGFRLIEKDKCDTPVVVAVSPNSPAKRSGLAVGDHIVYIGRQNVQKIPRFDEKVNLIKRQFEERGEVALVVLTAAAYHVLKRRGGFLDPRAFDYGSTDIAAIKPRLYHLSLKDHEHNFGLILYSDNPTYIREVEPDSASDAFGVEKNDKILEIDGQDTTFLSKKQMIELLQKGQQRRQLNLLVIDPAGYDYSIKHAIPINSLVPFVKNIQYPNFGNDRLANGSIPL